MKQRIFEDSKKEITAFNIKYAKLDQCILISCWPTRISQLDLHKHRAMHHSATLGAVDCWFIQVSLSK